MTDGPTETPPQPVITEGMSKAEVKEALAEHRREMDDHFAQQREHLLEEIRGLGASDATEKAELKEQLKNLTEWQTKQMTAQEEADRIKGDKHTIVTPPESLAPPATPPATPPAEGGGTEERKGSRLSRFW
jgi:hypothetical protein